ILVIEFNGSGSHGTSAYVDDRAVVHAGGKLEIAAGDGTNDNPVTLDLTAGNVAVGTGSAGVGAAAIVLIRHGNVDAAVHQNADIQANGGEGLMVTADQG